MSRVGRQAQLIKGDALTGSGAALDHALAFQVFDDEVEHALDGSADDLSDGQVRKENKEH